MHYLVSTAGHPNVGDELIARTWLRELRRRAPDSDVWLDCPFPSGAQALLAGEHPRLRCVDTLWRLCWEAPGGTPWDTATSVHAALDDAARAPRWVPGLRLFARAATVHLLGGGYVHDLWPRHVGLLAAVAHAAGRGAATAVTGQGFAPMAAATAGLVQRLCAGLDVVDVRDRPSAALVGRPDACSGDDLWLADVAALLDPARAAELDVAVCVQADMLDADDGALTTACLRHLDAWAADPARTAVVEGMPGDRAVHDRLAGLLPGLRRVPWTDLLDRGVPAGPHQRWFSTRFHPHLVAAAAGARGVAVPAHPGYYDVKHASLLAAGSPWAVRGPGAPGVARLDAPADPARLLASGERVLARKGEIATALYGPVREVADLSSTRG
ncbi:polysaccharide pyruvyl transferase family protein [Geodermatophilus sp. YIM 151500]|uniref:polysaccharide pyruvyl transferase family protein n=1 Tax=Geodermatophilus sp. YIM 151500 TaxID=2984531 RepID=UPI0021E45CE0|nr:polysaccharide pyruvyl transferase family protein [Geodermatophilus sp. YIM 151500]MCV2488553.1 polysaccharide pyruvyl transferase family protein [Geodermatophilus sp. YIM 151500]